MDEAELARLQQAVAAGTADRETQLALLQALVDAARWSEAEAVGTALLQTPSPPPAAHTLMGVVYAKLERPQEAIAQCRQALAQRPDEALALFNLGTLLAQQGENEEALTCLQRAIVFQEDWAEAHYNLGVVLLRLERYSEAIEAFERALDHCEIFPEAHFNRGNAHALRGLDPQGTLDYYELDCAVNAYKIALQQRPGYLAALYNLGVLYTRMASREGLRVWDQYLAAAADDPAEATWRARAREHRQDLQERLP